MRMRAHYRIRTWKESSPACNELDFWGVVKWLRHGFLEPAFGGSNPPTPANAATITAKADKRLIDYRTH